MLYLILSVIFQAKIFFTAICLGIAIGLLYDLIRLTREFLSHNRIIIDIEDSIFWIVVSILVFFISLYQNNGEIRAFFILGISIGLVLYFILASKFFIKIFKVFIHIAIKYLLLFIKITLTPIILLMKLFKSPIKYFYNKIKRFLLKRRSFYINLINKIKAKFNLISKIRAKINMLIKNIHKKVQKTGK